MKRLVIAVLVLALAGAGLLGWRAFAPGPAPLRWLGYAEADYQRIAPTQEGRLVRLAVSRGDEVAAGALLFTQDDADDRAAVDQATAQLAEAREKLADLEGAGRAAEIEQARADLADQQASYDSITRDLARNEALVRTGAATRQLVDQQRDQQRSALAHLAAAKARLALITEATGRAHAIAAQAAAVAAAEAALRQAQWKLDQRRVTAPDAGRIADTYAQPGETVAAAAPVVELLPPGNILVRFYIPETALARMRTGDTVGIACDSCPPGLQARVSFIATAPEYTPPVIYSAGARGSLVYLVEARPDPARKPLLKPGQPVDVTPFDTSARP
jgi:HlyD family secretion protein